MGQQQTKGEGSPLSGLRVVRGLSPKWQGEPEPDAGRVGTIVAAWRSSSGSEHAIVYWDHGVEKECCYSDGHDLRVFDNAPSGVRHEGVQCDECNAMDIAGTRWTCQACKNYDLCTHCYMSDRHDKDHSFSRRSAPGEAEVVLPPRNKSSDKRIEAKGFLKGATVVRGRDWAYKDQDGAKLSGKEATGTVVGLTSFGSHGARNSVCVSWMNEPDIERLYRLGYGGKVDLKCTKETDRKEYYYLDHLAVVGEDHSLSFKVGDLVRLKEGDTTSPALDTRIGDDDGIQSKVNVGVVRKMKFSNKVTVEFKNKEERLYDSTDLETVARFKAGATVKVTGDEQEITACQNWPSHEAAKIVGKEGTVGEVFDDGDICINVGDAAFVVNPLLCRPSDSSGTDNKTAKPGVDQQPKTVFQEKDIVTIIENEDTAKSLQKGHGGWNEDMKESLGKTGEVLTIHPTGDVRVKVNARRWTYNPKCLMPASPEARDEYLQRSSSSSSDSDSGSSLSDVGRGKRGGIRVRVKVKGEAQAKVMFSGLMEGLSFSMPTKERKPAAFSVGHFVKIREDAEEVRKTRQVDVASGNGASYSEIAGKAARVRKVVCDDASQPMEIEVIVDSKLWTLTPEYIQMCHNMSTIYSRYEKDKLPRTHQFDSDAVLVRAVQSQLRSIDDVNKVLSKHRSKLNTKIRGFAPLHIAAIVGRSDIVELLLKEGAIVDLADDRYSCTALHHAAYLGYSSAVRILLMYKPKCNALGEQEWTALHYAAAGLGDSAEIVNDLLDANFELDAKDKHGRTALHVAIKRHNFAVIEKLITRGADLHTKDKEGLTALQMAVICQSRFAVTKILSQDSNAVNDMSSRGMTALHLAASRGYKTMVELLLSEKLTADEVNCRETQTSHGDTPLLLAVRSGYDDVADLLKKHDKADLSAKDKQGQDCDRIAEVRHQIYGAAKGLNRLTCSKTIDRFGEKAIGDFSIGDYVRVDDDVAALREMQREYGGWSPLMENIAGKTGKVTWKFAKSGKGAGGLRVYVDGMNWSLNPASCTKINEEGNKTKRAADLTADESSIGDGGGSSRSRSSSSSRSTSDSGLVKSPALRVSDDSDDENLARLVMKSNTSQLKSRLKTLSPDKMDKRYGDVCALHVAAGRGKVEAIKLLVDSGANVNVNDVDDDTPLHHAVVRGEAEAAKTLISYGKAKLNLANKRLHTPMHYACGASSENLKVLKELLSQDSCDVNAQDQDGDTPLHCAIGKGHVRIVEELVADERVKPDKRNRLGFNALHHAAFRGEKSIVNCILAKHQDLVNGVSGRGQTALHLAVIHGRLDVVRLLLDEGKADMDKSTELESRTPLLCAVAHGRLDAAKLLLEKGAKISAKDEAGNSCLHLELKRHRLLYGSTKKPSHVREKQQLDMWRLLLNYNANVMAENKAKEIVKDLADRMGFPLKFDVSETAKLPHSSNERKEPAEGKAPSAPFRHPSSSEPVEGDLPNITTASPEDGKPDAATVVARVSLHEDTTSRGESVSDNKKFVLEVQQQMEQPNPNNASTDSVPKVEQDAKPKAGDWVQISEDKLKVKRIQRSHGGWYDGMADALGKWCKVDEVDVSEDGDIRVSFIGRKWRFGMECVQDMKAGGDAEPYPTFKRGVTVKICRDKDKVKSWQKARWNDRMTNVLGKVGRVMSVRDDGDVQVRVAGQLLRFNPLCLSNAGEAEVAAAKQQSPFFVVGDVVKVIGDLDKARELQQGHGGWCEPMKDALGQVGTVVDIDSDDDVRVSVCGRRWVFNSQCLAAGSEADKDLLKAVAVDALFKPGDSVKISDNIDEVRELQRGHGGWVSDMSKVLGKVAKVIEIDSDNDVRVRVRGRTLSMNPRCLKPVTGDGTGDKAEVESIEESASSSSSSSGSPGDGFQEFLKSLRRRLDTDGESPKKTKKTAGHGTAGDSSVREALGSSSDSATFNVGDYVTVVAMPPDDPDQQSAQTAQDARTGMSAKVSEFLGKTAQVLAVLDKGQLKASFAMGGEPCILTAKCCRHATEAEKREMALKPDGFPGKPTTSGTAPSDSSSSDSSSDGFFPTKKKKSDSDSDSDRGRESLTRAVAQSNVSGVKKALLKAKEQVNESSSGIAPLHIAAGKGAVQIILLLLDAGADVSLKDKDGDTPLHHAALTGEHPAVGLLLQRGAPPDAVNERSLTPLHVAILSMKCSDDHTDPLPKSLLEKCDINAKDEDGNTALHMVVRKDCVHALGQLLQLDKIDVTCKNDLGLSAVHLAVYQRSEATLKLIMEHAAIKKNTDAVDIENGYHRTALHMAAQLNFLAGARLLITEEKIKAKVNSKDTGGRTALQLAIINGNVEVVKFLVEECKVDLTPEEKKTAEKAQQHYGVAGRTKAVLAYIIQKLKA